MQGTFESEVGSVDMFRGVSPRFPRGCLTCGGFQQQKLKSASSAGDEGC